MADTSKSIGAWVKVNKIINSKFVNTLAYAVPVVFFAIMLSRINTAALAANLKNVSILWFVFALIVSPSIIIFKSIQWRILLGKRHPLAFGKIFRIAAIREMAEQILPMRTSMGVNIYCMGIKERIGKTFIASSLFAEEMAEGAGVILLFGLVAILGKIPEWMRISICSFLSIGFVVFFVSWWLSRKQKFSIEIDKRWSFWTKVKSHFKNWLYHMHSIKSLKLFLSISSMAFIIKIIESLILFILALSLGLNLTLINSLFIVVAINMVAVAPVTPGNYGFFEGVAMLALIYLGINTAEAFSMALIYHLVCSLPLIAVGYIATIGYDWRKKQGERGD